MTVADPATSPRHGDVSAVVIGTRRARMVGSTAAGRVGHPLSSLTPMSQLSIVKVVNVPPRRARRRERPAMAEQTNAVLDAVARRLHDEPERVLPTLRLLADLDALPEPDDTETIVLARKLNAERLAQRQAAFRSAALSTAQVRALLGGITRQAVASRVAHRTLLAREIAGTSYFPDWQFGPDGTVPGLDRVVPALLDGGRSPLAADALMRAPLPEEGGRTPAQRLAAGDVDTVLHYVRTAGLG